MKKYVSMTFFIVLVFFIQMNLFPAVPLLKINPNLLIVITCGYGLTQGHKEGMICGIIAGILLDNTLGNIPGYYALPYMNIGYICGYFKKYLNADNYIIPSVFCGVGDFLCGIYIFVFSFALRNRLNILFYLRTIIIPEVIYTILVSLILFRLMILYNNRVEVWVRKRGHKVVKKRVRQPSDQA